MSGARLWMKNNSYRTFKKNNFGSIVSLAQVKLASSDLVYRLSRGVLSCDRLPRLCRAVCSTSSDLLIIFSERELTFTFAICCRPSVCRLSSVVCRLSVCLSVVCLSVVCNVRAPYSGGSTFRQYFYGIWYPSHPLTSTENFMEIVPGEPLRRGSWTQEG